MKFIERISWPQVAVLAIFAASGVAALVLTPAETIAKIAALDWRAIVFATISAVAAVFGIWRGQGVMKPKIDPKTGVVTWSAIDVDPATGVLRQSHRPPPLPSMSIAPSMMPPAPDDRPTPAHTPSALARTAPVRPPPPSREGSARIAMLALLSFGFAAVLVILVFGSGCGGAVQTHTTAIQLTATTYGAAVDAAEVVYRAELQECDVVGCVDLVEQRWEPVGAASSALILALQSWVVALDLIKVAGDVGALWRVALERAEAVAERWNEWARAARAVGWDLPDLPAPVLAALAADGGQ